MVVVVVVELEVDVDVEVLVLVELEEVVAGMVEVVVCAVVDVEELMTTRAVVRTHERRDEPRGHQSVGE